MTRSELLQKYNNNTQIVDQIIAKKRDSGAFADRSD
jgi:hypothetical protein